MAADLLKFVDSIASAPTVRLDLNDGVTWVNERDGMDVSPPELTKFGGGAPMTDGDFVSGSTYRNRVVRLTLSLATSTTDATATALQTLHRELDRETNYLMWQPAGASAPVFFRTFRTPPDAVQPISPLNTSQVFTLAIDAEPFALGIREDVVIGTVTNDPAAASRGLFFDVTGAKGDVAAPCVIVDGGAFRSGGLLACRRHGTPANAVFFQQCENASLVTDTTGGGSTDAVMSGAANPNFVRTSFATNAALVQRLVLTLSPVADQRGTYRLFACVRRSDATSSIQVRARSPHGAVNVTGSTVTVPLTTSRQLVDLGLFTWGATAQYPGRFATEAQPDLPIVWLDAGRTSGTGTLDWDYLLIVPADEQLMLWDVGQAGDPSGVAVFDGANEATYGAAATAGLYTGTTAILEYTIQTVGGFPALQPNQTNRFYYVTGQAPSSGFFLHDKTHTASITVSYWPRYLYARPATT